MSLDLSPFHNVVIVTWTELDGAVEVGQGLVVPSHGPECFTAVGEGQSVVRVEFDGAVEVGQGLVIAAPRQVARPTRRVGRHASGEDATAQRWPFLSHQPSARVE
jgi:hypothetical protein